MKNKKYSTNYKQQTINHRGFSIIEVMLAVFLISVGIMATLALISVGIKHSTESRRQLIAAMLSQEGIELVRNIRDTSAKSSSGDSFDKITTTGDFMFDYNDSPLVLRTFNNGKLKYFNGLYEHDGSGKDSQFSRKINIIVSGDQRTVYSIVVWENASFPSNPPTELKCNLTTKCAFTKITLNKWRE